MLQLHIQAFHLPKAGNRQEEYEDAWGCGTAAMLTASSWMVLNPCYKEAWDLEKSEIRLAIADGASDAFESRLWARALVQAYIQEPPKPERESILHWLVHPTQDWEAKINWEQMPWYAVEKAKRGAFSTLLGVVFKPTFNKESTSSVVWQALALGDACFFYIRRNRQIVYFPIENAAHFSTTPPLLSNQYEYNQRSLKEIKTQEGECFSGDLFIIATDALSAWYFKQCEANKQPWQRLTNLSPSRFEHLVGRLRKDGKIRNDDVTLLLGQIEEQEEELSLTSTATK